MPRTRPTDRENKSVALYGFSPSIACWGTCSNYLTVCDDLGAVDQTITSETTQAALGKTSFHSVQERWW